MFHPNIIELSMADSAGGSIATGAALTGRRPIYVVRYQGFLWYNIVSIVNYAAKSKELWDVECPIFLRAIAMEGGIGPVAGSSHYSLAYKMPGIRIVSPMTPLEYKKVWDEFVEDSIPYFVSEHRGSYKVDYETPPILHDEADLTVFCLSITRFKALEAIWTQLGAQWMKDHDAPDGETYYEKFQAAHFKFRPSTNAERERY